MPPDSFLVPKANDSQAWLNFLLLGSERSLYFLTINFRGLQFALALSVLCDQIDPKRKWHPNHLYLFNVKDRCDILSQKYTYCN